jgi:hypothetical protein
MFFNSSCVDTNWPTGPAGPWCAVTTCNAWMTCHLCPIWRYCVCYIDCI